LVLFEAVLQVCCLSGAIESALGSKKLPTNVMKLCTLQDRGSRTDTGSDLDSDDSSNAENKSDNDVVGPAYTGVKTRAKNKYLQSVWSDKGKKYYKYLLTQIRSRKFQHSKRR